MGNKLLDQILVCLNERRGLPDLPSSGLTNNMVPTRRALSTLIDDPRFWQLEETLELAVLAHKASLIPIAAQFENLRAHQSVAARYSRRALDILRRPSGRRDREVRQWLAQAEAVHNAMFGKE